MCAKSHVYMCVKGHVYMCVKGHVYMCVKGHVYMCVKGIEFFSVRYLIIIFVNCSDSVALFVFVFHFIAKSYLKP
jgi:hypothetical protein